jgi:hypothetical protein
MGVRSIVQATIVVVTAKPTSVRVGARGLCAQGNVLANLAQRNAMLPAVVGGVMARSVRSIANAQIQVALLTVDGPAIVALQLAEFIAKVRNARRVARGKVAGENARDPSALFVA